MHDVSAEEVVALIRGDLSLPQLHMDDVRDMQRFWRDDAGFYERLRSAVTLQRQWNTGKREAEEMQTRLAEMMTRKYGR